jgi:hypothetical protein
MEITVPGEPGFKAVQHPNIMPAEGRDNKPERNRIKKYILVVTRALVPAACLILSRNVK